MPKQVKNKLTSYERLAEALNNLPQGFPKDKEGMYLKLLQWIFTQEEAEIASNLKVKFESLEVLANKLQLPKKYLKEKLSLMYQKGQIRKRVRNNIDEYALLPFILGIYENQIDRMDKDFANYFEHYFNNTQLTGLADTKPAIFKVIPIKKTIEARLTIHPYEDVEQLIRKAKSWGIGECICKKQKELINKPCKYPKSVCLAFAGIENAFLEEGTFKKVPMDKALELLKETEEAGLVHCSYNIQNGHSFICNCCTCCCSVLRALTELKQPNAIAKSNYIISVDEEKCTGCGLCLERCQFNALDLIGDVVERNDRCVGCGVCAIKCLEKALSLINRKIEDIAETPKNFEEWLVQKANSRGINI